MIHVIARIEAQPGRRTELLDAFHQLVPLVHQETGCIEYGPVVDFPSGIGAQALQGDDVFLVIEKWQSLEHLQAHLQATHMAEYRNKVKHLVKDTSLNVLAPA